MSRQSGLAAVALDRPQGLVLWDAARGQSPQPMAGAGGEAAASVALSPDGRFLVGSYTGRLRVWDVRTRREVCSRPSAGAEESLCFSPDGALLASASLHPARILLRSTATWKPIREFPGLASNPTGRPRLEFTPDGRTLVAGRTDGMLRICSVRDGSTTAGIRAPNNLVRTFRLSPDGRLLAVGGFDSPIQLWDLRQRRRLTELKGHKSLVLALAFSPSGRTLASASDDGTIKFWNLSMRQELVTLQNVGAQVTNVEFLADEVHLLTRERQGELRVYAATPPEGPPSLAASLRVPQELARCTPPLTGALDAGQTPLPAPAGAVRVRRSSRPMRAGQTGFTR